MAVTVTPIANGPYMVKGEVELVDAQGQRIQTQGDECYLCRCGGSGKKPFCDGTHKKIGFQG